MCISLSPNPEMQSQVCTQKRTCYVMQRTGSVKQKTDAKGKKPFFLSFLSLFLMCEQLQGCSLLRCGGGMGWEAVLN